MSAGTLHVAPPSRPLPPPISLEEAFAAPALATAEREGRTAYIQDTLAVDFAAASDEQSSAHSAPCGTTCPTPPPGPVASPSPCSR